MLISVKQWQTHAGLCSVANRMPMSYSLLFMTFLEAAMDATAQGMMDTFFGELAVTGL